MSNFAWQDFHFLRPWWLLAAIPVLWLVWQLARSHRSAGAWENVIDAHLLSHLLRSNAAPMNSRNSSRSTAMYRLLGVAGVLAVLALAGPTGSKLPQPVYRAHATHIVVLSLAPTMDAPDVAPSRIARARLKVLDLLARQREGQVALVAYSAEPYVVSPLTEDAKTVAALVPVLTTDLMPVSGDNLGAALTKVGELLAHAGASHGEVIVVTDGVRDLTASNAAAQLHSDGHRVSVLAVGTPDGAPVPSAGGKFLHDAAGAIVIPRLELASLQQVAAVGGGRTATLSVNDADLTHLLDWEPTTRSTDQARRLDRRGDQGLARWRDEGPWLVLLLLLPAALLFRRGWLVVIVVAIIGVQPDHAYALDTSNVWLRKDQQAQRAMSAEDFPRAAELFDDPTRKGAALYRAQRFAEAAQAFSQVNSSEGFYNRGNALAKAGQLNEALAAYNEALKLTPAHQDAVFNKALVEKLIKDSPQQEPQPPNQAEQQNQQSREPKNSAGQQQPADGQQGADADRTEPAKGKNAPDDKQTKSAKQSQDSSKTGDQEQAAADSSKPHDAQSQAGTPQSGKREPMTNDEQRESSQVLEQWLGQVTDDPGGLLREKFRRQHLRRLKSGARE